MQVGGGEDAFQRHFRRLSDGDTETFDSIFDEMFVGVLAAGAVRDDTAAFGAHAVDKLVTQADSGRIGVYGDDDFFQVLEMGFHETVEPREIGVGARRNGDDAFKSGGDGRGGIQFAFVDDAGRLPYDGVDVVRNQFGSLHHFEMLLATAEFRVHELPALEVVEADATLLRGGLRHKFFLLRDAQRGYDGLRDAARFDQPTLCSFGQRGLRSVKHRTMEMLRNGCHTALAGCTTFCLLSFFIVVGDVKVGSAMVAVAMSGVDIDTQRTVALVMPRRETLITDCLDNSTRAMTYIDLVTGKISHNFCFTFLD